MHVTLQLTGQGDDCTQQQSHLSAGLFSDVSYKASSPASHLITEIISLDKNKIVKKIILYSHGSFSNSCYSYMRVEERERKEL